MPYFIYYALAGLITYGVIEKGSDVIDEIKDDSFPPGVKEIVIPGPGEELADKNYFKNGLTYKKWDDALLGLGILAVVMFSKPWK